jgi:hypothetical protein
MDSPSKAKLKILISLLILLCLLLLCLIFYLFYLLSLLITSTGSVLLFLLSLLVLSRLILRLSVFPGSFWLWKRSIESHFCREMSLQLLQRVQDLRLCLDLLLDQCSDCEKEEFIERAVESTTYAKRMVTTIIDTYSQDKDRGSITSYGLSLQALLLEFQDALQRITLLLDNKENSLWDFIDLAQDGKDWCSVVTDEYPANTSAKAAHTICLKLESRILQSCGDLGLIGKITRWLFDSSLGTFNQMRIELESRYYCEQVWLKVGKVQLDCMLISNPEGMDMPTIIFCNPNAGLYEFAYYQSEWLDYYISLGINVFLWNYRGYGRSGGSPSPENLKQDGQAVVEYLRNTKNARILGVHGESLGGIIAVHLARTCEIDFLFVDRGFGNIADVVMFSFGKWARLLLQSLTRWDFNYSLEYLFVNCYKVISCDPHDSMINDLASLKSGVAIKLVETRGLEIADGITPAQLDISKYFHILSQSDTSEMLNSVVCLMDFAMKHIKSDLERGPVIDMTNESSYQPLGKDQELIEDDVVNNLLHRVFAIVDGLDAGGKALSSLASDSDPLLGIKLWLMVLDVWGSFTPIEPTEICITRGKSLEKLNYAVEELKDAVAEHEYNTQAVVREICKESKVLEKTLSKVIVYMKNQVGNSRKEGELSPGREEMNSFRHYFEYERAGYLIPLNCGHSGKFSNLELALLETHLARIGFIK